MSTKENRSFRQVSIVYEAKTSYCKYDVIFFEIEYSYLNYELNIHTLANKKKPSQIRTISA